jgi:hypothetical protein
VDELVRKRYEKAVQSGFVLSGALSAGTFRAASAGAMLGGGAAAICSWPDFTRLARRIASRIRG